MVSLTRPDEGDSGRGDTHHDPDAGPDALTEDHFRASGWSVDLKDAPPAEAVPPAAGGARRFWRGAALAVISAAIGGIGFAADQVEPLQPPLDHPEIRQDEFVLHRADVSRRIDRAGRMGQGRVAEQTDDVQQRVCKRDRLDTASLQGVLFGGRRMHVGSDRLRG